MKWISTQRDFDEAMARARHVPEFAVDTEADSLHSYFDKVCLIQLSAGGEDYVIDPLAGLDLSALGELLGDPARRKVLHGADYDLRILQRDFGYRIFGLTDTMLCAQLLGYPAFGLAALLDRHFGVKVDKKHQLADWAMRPLTSEMLRYAALDTHYLVRLAEILRGELDAAGRLEWAEEEFERLEAIRFEQAEPDEEAFRKIKGSNRLPRRGLGALSKLYHWREELAKRMDRPPFKILSNEVLIGISTDLPRTRDAMVAIKGVSPHVFARHGRELLAIVEETMALGESELPERGESKKWIRDRVLEKRVDALKKVRDRIAEDLKIESSVLAPRHVLTAIATRMPQSVEDLQDIAAMRRWQRSITGEAFVQQLKALT